MGGASPYALPTEAQASLARRVAASVALVEFPSNPNFCDNVDSHFISHKLFYSPPSQEIALFG
jgi:hypothetical protein